jgi:hypothetical protein
LTLEGVKAAIAVKQIVASLTKGIEFPTPAPREVARMQERLHRCAEVSAFCMELQRALPRATAS